MALLAPESLVLPLTAPTPLEIRGDPFPAAPVEIELLDPLPSGIVADAAKREVGPDDDRAVFALTATDAVERLDAPLSLRIRGTAGGESVEVEVDLLPVARVTSADDDGPGSLRAVIRAALVVAERGGGDRPAIRFDPEAFSGADRTILVRSAIVVDGSLDLDGLLGPGGARVEIAAEETTRIFDLSHGAVRLAHLDLRGGDAGESDGGALYDNQSDGAAAIHVAEGLLTLTNTTIVENAGNTVVSCKSADLSFNTIAKNEGTFHWSGTLRAVGNLFAENTHPFGGDLSASLGSTFTSLGDNFFGALPSNLEAHENDLAGTVDEPLPPRLGTFGDHGGPTPTVLLLENSPARDAVPADRFTTVDGTPLTTDQRGVARPQDGACDIGAAEGS